MVCKSGNSKWQILFELGILKKAFIFGGLENHMKEAAGNMSLAPIYSEEKNCLVGGLQSEDFFRGDDKEGIDARNEVCMLWPSSVFICSRIGCQIGCQLHQTLNSKPHKGFWKPIMRTINHILPPSLSCACAFPHLYLCKKLVSLHIMCRLQFLLWRTCLCGWRREDRLVLFFFTFSEQD